MKELSIEQKAKLYDEALTKARNIVNSINVGLIGKDSFEAVFPELKDSEDERIGKELLNHLKKASYGETLVVSTLDYKRWADWLEKQGEQKPALSEEDEKILQSVLWHVSNSVSNGKSQDIRCDLTEWLKSLKDRVVPQSKQEWSEVDENLLGFTLSNLAELKDRYGEEYGKVRKCMDWLESLRPQNWTKEDKERYISCLQRLGTGNPEQPETINSKWFKKHVYPQNTWKPSEEQLCALEHATMYNTLNANDAANLAMLYNDLKKLKG